MRPMAASRLTLACATAGASDAASGRLYKPFVTRRIVRLIRPPSASRVDEPA